jgi:hypothetical protein
MVAPLPTGGPGLFPYAMVAVFMVVGSIYVLSRLLPRRDGPPTLATGILMVGILGMTTGLWFAEIFAILDPGDASVVSVFIALNSMMGVVGAWAIGLFYRAEEKRLPSRGWRWPLSLATLVVGNELLMGIAFVLALTGPARYASAGWPGLAAVVADGIDSVWFFFAMFVTMEFLVFWLPLSAAQRRALAAFSVSALVGPWVVLSPLEGSLAAALVMALVSALLAQEVLYRGPVGAGYLAAFAATGLAVLVYVGRPSELWSPLPYALTSFFVMLAELLLLVRWAAGRALSPSTALQPSPLAPETERPTSPSG